MHDGDCDATERIRELVHSFPTLQRAPGTSPWDPRRLDGWAASPAPSDGARHAAAFVLAVWDRVATWECGRFSVVDAYSVWDKEHRYAFLHWAHNPW